MPDSHSVAQYFSARLARQGATETECAIARVVGELVAHGGAQYVSTRTIRARCLAAGVRSPWSLAPVGYGTIARVLNLLRATGVLAWRTAYVLRWHRDTAPQPGQPRVIRERDGSYRLPARCLQLVGIAGALAALSRAPALGANSIERESPGEALSCASSSGAVSVSTSPCAIERASSAETAGSPLDWSAWRELHRRL